MPQHFTLRSLDGTTAHDAAGLLGPGCQNRLAVGCIYSTIRLEEVARKKLPELKGEGKWRFDIAPEATA